MLRPERSRNGVERSRQILLSSVNLKLRPKLLNDLKPGTRIVSNTFDMGDWRPEKEVTVGDPEQGAYGLSRTLFLWTVPPRPKN